MNTPTSTTNNSTTIDMEIKSTPNFTSNNPNPNQMMFQSSSSSSNYFQDIPIPINGPTNNNSTTPGEIEKILPLSNQAQQASNSYSSNMFSQDKVFFIGLPNQTTHDKNAPAIHNITNTGAQIFQAIGIPLSILTDISHSISYFNSNHFWYYCFTHTCIYSK
eukprot:gene9714-11929_t